MQFESRMKTKNWSFFDRNCDLSLYNRTRSLFSTRKSM